MSWRVTHYYRLNATASYSFAWHCIASLCVEVDHAKPCCITIGVLSYCIALVDASAAAITYRIVGRTLRSVLDWPFLIKGGRIQNINRWLKFALYTASLTLSPLGLDNMMI